MLILNWMERPLKFGEEEYNRKEGDKDYYKKQGKKLDEDLDVIAGKINSESAKLEKKQEDLMEHITELKASISSADTFTSSSIPANFPSSASTTTPLSCA